MRAGLLIMVPVLAGCGGNVAADPEPCEAPAPRVVLVGPDADTTFDVASADELRADALTADRTYGLAVSPLPPEGHRVEVRNDDARHRLLIVDGAADGSQGDMTTIGVVGAGEREAFVVELAGGLGTADRRLGGHAVSRAPFVTPAHATTMLALVDHALAYVPPEHALAYLRGFLVARPWDMGEPTVFADDPRREPGEGTAIGRVEIVKRT